VYQLPGERQAADRADRARHLSDLQRGQAPQHRLLRRGPRRIRQRGQQAQHDSGHVGAPGAGAGHPDKRHAGERDTGTEQQPAGKTLPEQCAREHRDKDRTHFDQHCRGTGIQALLGRVERHVVETEPGHPAQGHQSPFPPRRPHPGPSCQQSTGQGEAADQQPP
jgi:hypothetical protein